MKCPKCKSKKIYRFGHRPVWWKGHKKWVQAWQCDHCGHQWRKE